MRLTSSLRITSKDALMLLVLLAGFAGIALVASRVAPSATLFITGAALLLALAFLVLYCYRSLLKAVQFYHEQGVSREGSMFHQIEAFQQLLSIVQPRLPLTAMRGMAISPDFGVFLVSQIQQQKPKVIVELGCGVSTLISAYALEGLGGGHVISFDHDSKYAEICRTNVRAHGLESFVSIHHAPLREIDLEGRKWKYYDIDLFQNLPGIDLLVVDGPPAFLQPLIRYPALPLLYRYLSPGAVILVDDAGRDDERKMVKEWQSNYPSLGFEFHDLEKGLVLLRKVESVQSSAA